MLIYDPQGKDPMMPGEIISGLLISMLAASVATWLLSRSTAAATSYLVRVLFCGVLGILISFSTHLPLWNWMGYPLDFTTAMIADTIIGWLLAGLGIAAIIKMPRPEMA